MNQNQWTAVDEYFSGQFACEDEVLRAALEANHAAGLPAIDVTPNQGRLLMILAKAIGAKRILEIGTLGGYSTIWLGRALPADGRLVTLELDARHAEVAKGNLARASLGSAVDVRLGPALETLPKLEAEGFGPFDLIFIDADKPNNPGYAQWALKLCRPGGLIIVDNVVREGAVLEKDSADPAVQGVRKMNQILAADPRACATAIQTVGSKGYDGFAVILVA